MIPGSFNTDAIRTTSYKVVLPFYIYAALSFLIAALLLLLCSQSFLTHYFQPHILAITHLMALGWGTMIILGASHQLVPVLVESKLYSNKLGYTSFVLAAIGIPLLVHSFYVFDMGEPAKWGGRFILLAILAYVINLGVSIGKSKKENIHAIFVFTAVLWLFITGFLGLALVYNFTFHLFNHDSIHYLPLHVHAGLIGWFLLMVLGVGSRLIPMFLISKYQNVKLLWVIYFLVNGALISYIILFYFANRAEYIIVSWVALFIGILLFAHYCFSAFKQRIRKQVDEPMKISLLAVALMLVPLIILFIILISIAFFSETKDVSLSLTYGFLGLFGWITAIILGMTFKTLPFIVWNKVYRQRSSLGRTPNPKDMFNHPIFVAMSTAYIIGIILFALGSLLSILLLLRLGAAAILIAAVLYVFNVTKVLTHKPVML